MSVTCLQAGQQTYTKDVPRPQRDLPAASYVVLPSAPWCGGRIRILYRCNYCAVRSLSHSPDPTAQSGGRVRADGRNALASLVERYHHRAFGVALRILGGRQNAVPSFEWSVLEIAAGIPLRGSAELQVDRRATG